MGNKVRFTGIDIFKLFFACMIPFLHIGFARTNLIFMIREYISRLGVPFFFATSGLLLTKKCSFNRAEALKRYTIRIGRLLIIWLIIYIPIMATYHYGGGL